MRYLHWQIIAITAISLMGATAWALSRSSSGSLLIDEVVLAPVGIDRLVEVIVPERQDGWTSSLAQAVAEQRDYFQQEIHLSFQPGDNGLNSWDLVRERGADGHTVLIAGPGALIEIARNNDSRYQLDDIAVVSHLSSYHQAIAAAPDSAIADWEALVAYVRRAHEPLVLAGNNTALLSAEFLLKQAQINVVYQPMSTTQAVAALEDGEVDLVAALAIRLFYKYRDTVVPLVATGSGSLSAVERHYANVPTAQSLGYRGLSTPLWAGMHPQTAPDQVRHVDNALSGLFDEENFRLTVQRKGHLGRYIGFDQAHSEISQYIAAVRESDLDIFD